MATVVTRRFREACLRALPGLGRNVAYWRLLGHVLLDEFRDDRTGELVVPAKALAEFEGKGEQFRSKNYVAGEFLEAFRRDVVPGFAYRDWRYRDGRARTVTSHGLPQVVRDAWVEMNAEVAGGASDLVLLATGLGWTPKARAGEYRSETEAIIRSAHARGASRETLDVIEYQNGLASNGFAHVVNERMDEALALAESLPVPESRRHALAYLARIRVRPKPLVHAVENSPRPFWRGMNLLGVKSSVRRVLTQDWVDYDLKNAQLAIVASDWGIEELQAFLATGQSIWPVLIETLGLRAGDKPALKVAIYSVLFGRPKRRVIETLDAETGVAGVGKRFFKVPVVKLAFSARERRLKKLTSEYGGTTALGKVIPIPYGSGDPVEWVAGARSILAQQAQALELQLVHPVYELARTTRAFDVMLYQFDGFTVRYRDRRNCALWHRTILEAVERRARSLGVHTRLENDPGAAFAWDLEC